MRHWAEREMGSGGVGGGGNSSSSSSIKKTDHMHSARCI